MSEAENVPKANRSKQRYMGLGPLILTTILLVFAAGIKYFLVSNPFLKMTIGLYRGMSSNDIENRIGYTREFFRTREDLILFYRSGQKLLAVSVDNSTDKIDEWAILDPEPGTPPPFNLLVIDSACKILQNVNESNGSFERVPIEYLDCGPDFHYIATNKKLF